MHPELQQYKEKKNMYYNQRNILLVYIHAVIVLFPLEVVLLLTWLLLHVSTKELYGKNELRHGEGLQIFKIVLLVHMWSEYFKQSLIYYSLTAFIIPYIFHR